VLQAGPSHRFTQSAIHQKGLLQLERLEAADVTVASRPFGEAAETQEVAKIGKEFLETGASDYRELDLGFPRRTGSEAPLDNILSPRAGCLDHLVRRPVARFQEISAKTNRRVVNGLNARVREEFLVSTMRGMKPSFIAKGRSGPEIQHLRKDGDDQNDQKAHSI
jgi:hypothetical protein